MAKPPRQGARVRATCPQSDGLRDAFAPCPSCGRPVIVQVAKTVPVHWANPRTKKTQRVEILRWRRYRVPKEPVCGFSHTCLNRDASVAEGNERTHA